MRLISLTLASLIATTAVSSVAGSVAHAQSVELTAPAIVAPPDVVRADLSRELARRGHHEKIAGGVLLGLSSALLATSLVLNVVDAVGRVDHGCDYFSPTCSDGGSRGPLWLGSMATFAVGLPMLGAGIATYVVGGYHINKARRLQLVAATVAPLPGGGATAAATFRF
jgi:hypothetical protein